jgi:hypothetical protein
VAIADQVGGTLGHSFGQPEQSDPHVVARRTITNAR